MSKKTFSATPKPGRQPTAEEIASFEETGRAVEADAPPSDATETQKAVIAVNREHANPETREPVEPQIQEHGFVETREAGNAVSSERGDDEPEKLVRLTIDLPESAHTRFKVACAVSRRKMVQEVRSFIELRTAQLEAEARGDRTEF